MAQLSWNEIRARAHAFSKAWQDERREHAEANTFWDQFFQVFGIERRKQASFQEPVKKADGHGGFIDLLWRGVLLVEHKSAGKDLERARAQALDYFPGLKDRDLPRYVVVSDFAKMRLYDLEDESRGKGFLELPLRDLYKHVRAFAFMLGMKAHLDQPEPQVNAKAVLKLAKLHDSLAESGYTGKPLELLMTRLVFCFFADDTSIFEKNQFKEWVEANTREDGADLGARLNEIFEILDQDRPKRSRLLDEDLNAFDYVNGGLFADRIPTAAFNRELRDDLLDVSRLEWGQISPAIFGAMFQGLMSRVERRRLGAHYTRERNILRVIRPMFLDALHAEFEEAGGSKTKLRNLHQKLRRMQFFDPACGCGNFLVVTYRELRKLELAILRKFYRTDQQQMIPADLDQDVWVNVDQFHGIEIDEHSGAIARLAMWLTDHQMNLVIGEEFGTYFRRLPLVTAPNIVVGDALAMDWGQVVPQKGRSGDALVHVIGNPPFLGPKNFGKLLAPAQQESLAEALRPIEKAGVLDLVCGWYVKAAQYIDGTNIPVAFVSTSSIVQGEQVGVLWGWLLAQGIRIHFAHRSFQWSNEASGLAAVDCVVIGFGKFEVMNKVIFDYPDGDGEPVAKLASNINPYLVDFDDMVLTYRNQPISDAPRIGIGCKPVDGGYYLFTPEERAEFLKREPRARSLFRLWLGSDEFLDGTERWCLFVGDASPSELRGMPEVMKQINLVKRWRAGEIPNRKGKKEPNGPAKDTKEMANRPTKFHVTNIPSDTYIVFPRHSGEKRQYVPLGFCDPSEALVGDACLISAEATPYHFGILMSAMHNAWIRYTCGRLTSRFRYSATIVYNNFPWPNPSAAARTRIEKAAQAVMDVRAAHLKNGQSLADMYDPQVMPDDLRSAHLALDRAVDATYTKKVGMPDDERVRLLFALWQDQTRPQTSLDDEAPKRKRARALKA